MRILLRSPRAAGGYIIASKLKDHTQCIRQDKGDSGSSSSSGSETTFACDVTDWCADQRSLVRGYDKSLLPHSFRFSSIAVLLSEWIRSAISTLFVT